MLLVPIFLTILGTATVVSAAPAALKSLPGGGSSVSTQAANAEGYRARRYDSRSGTRSKRYADRPRYYSFKTKRGVTILCRTTWQGNRSTRTCWPRH